MLIHTKHGENYAYLLMESSSDLEITDTETMTSLDGHSRSGKSCGVQTRKSEPPRIDDSPVNSTSLRTSLTRHMSGVILDNRFAELEELDEALKILSAPMDQGEYGSWKVSDFILPPIVLLARMSKPLANAVAMNGGDHYPFLASSAQTVGLLLTALFFLCLSACTPEFYMEKSVHDKKLMLASFIVGLIAGLGDVCEMLANEYAGVGVSTVILGASRIVLTALMSKVALGKTFAEIQIWSLSIVTLSIIAFGMATMGGETPSMTSEGQQPTQPPPQCAVQGLSFGTVTEQCTSCRLILGVCLTMAAATFLCTQSIVKELFARSKATGNAPCALNYHEKMIFLFAGAGSSSFILAFVQLGGSVGGFFCGWQAQSIAVPVSVFAFASLSTLFTKQFGALTTVLLNIFSVVFVFFCTVLFFHQKSSPMVIVLIFLVALSVMMTTRGEKISKDEQRAWTIISERIDEGVEVLSNIKEAKTKQLLQPLLA